LVAAGLAPASAFACSCYSPGLNDFQISSDGLIPENAAGIAWLSSFASEDPADDLWVEHIEGDIRTRVDFSVDDLGKSQYIIRPVNWAEGNVYRVHGEAGDGSDNSDSLSLSATDRIREMEVQVGPPLDTSVVPELSPSATFRGPLTLLEYGGGCFSEFEGVAVDVWMNTPGASAANLNYTTVVDGKVWEPQTDLCTPVAPGASWVGRGHDRLVAVCDKTFIEEKYRLLPGPHTVSMEAKLPGTDIVFTTETITVDLTCPAEESSGGCQSTGGPSSLTPLLALFGLLGWRRRNL